jgi:hypothetical protein
MVRAALSNLHERLLALLASGEAAATIERVLQDPTGLAEVASHSYAHPNGFRKLVLATPADGTKLRVHHWPQGDPAPSNVHNHRWAFASAIVVGRVDSALFEIAEPGDPVEQYRFEPSQAGGRYKLIPAGAAPIRVSSVAQLGPGSTYALDADQLHQVRADPRTLSLVLSGPPERDHSDVFRPASLAPQPRDLPLLPAADIRESLELLAAELRSKQAPPREP